jgi:molybdenum cofactor biosynthesis enzyme
MAGVIYDFEELGEEDLFRSPLAALRALRCAGVLVSRAGWLAAPPEVRLALTHAGTRDIVDLAEVQKLLERVPLRELKLYPRWDDPSPYEVPAALVESLARARQISLAFWQALRPLDRHVLMMLAKNTRLLWRALDELARSSRYGDEVLASRAWTGLLGRCQLELPDGLAARITSPEFMDGRALVLARVAGVRAARRAGELLDLSAGVGSGPIELGCHTGWTRAGALLQWQAHVSSAQGEFFPAASLLAAVTAAVALFDMVGGHEPGVSVVIDGAMVREERWLIEGDDEVTITR